MSETTKDFKFYRNKWEKQLEEIISEMAAVKTLSGYRTGVDLNGLIEACNKTMNDIEKAMNCTELILVPGDRKNEA